MKYQIINETGDDLCGLWLRWDKFLLDSGKNDWSDETDIFIEDNGEYIGFIRMAATKSK
ncbi:MAG: hypothetical protein LBD23_11830 [Oscillospiraceae bacterium]|jgi:hypothetical protein|nr:hypothetical protein [Oscillospiraceae bacterium]